MPPPSQHQRLFDWPRYWVTGAETESDGFFVPGHAATLEADVLVESESCLVLLGEPGLGKSHAVRDAVSLSRASGRQTHSVDLGMYDDGPTLTSAVVDAPAWRDWIAGAGDLTLFLDGLDEALLHVRGIQKWILAWIEELTPDQVGKLRLRIACRSADWIDGFDTQLEAALDTAVEMLRLAPLRAVDAGSAARMVGFDGDAFVSEVRARELERLAASPLTLQMLLDEQVAAGRLPDSHRVLYENASLRLLDEHDSVRRQQQPIDALPAGRRLAVAGRVSAAMLLCGRAAVSDRPGAGPGADIRVRELAGFAESDPLAAGDADFEVTETTIREVLGTAFFVSVGQHRYGFWHRALGEFLAARYLVHHQLEVEQLLSLLATPEASDRRLLPQLREVTAWVALESDDLLVEVIDREPELLLRTAGVPLEPEVRKKVVDRFLSDRHAGRVERFDRRMRAAYPSLDHPGLASQILAALSSERSEEVREAAITLAAACEVRASESILAAIALDADEKAQLRSQALWALKGFASSTTRRLLLPLATEHIEADADDEIKGQALAAVFPAVARVAEILPGLTPARMEYLVGSYRMFVSDLLAAITVDDLPLCLEWALRIPEAEDRDHVLDELGDGVLALALGHLDLVPILDGAAKLIVARLSGYNDLVGRDHRDAFEPSGARRQLVIRIVETGQLGVEDLVRLTFSSPPLVDERDSQWLLDRTRSAIGAKSEPLWAELAARGFAPERVRIADFFELVESSTAFAIASTGWITPQSLESRDAIRNLKFAREAREARELEEVTTIDGDVQADLEAFESGDVVAWERASRRLAPAHGGYTVADLTQFARWEALDASVRNRLVRNAPVYLATTEVRADDWIGKQRVVPHAWAAYRALRLLATEGPEAFRQLSSDVWKKWAPIVLSFPLSAPENDPVRDLLTRQLATHAEDELLTWSRRLIGIENSTGDGHLFVLYRLRPVASAKLTRELESLLSDASLQPKARADIVEHLTRTEPARALAVGAPFLRPEAIELDRSSAIAIATVLFGRLPAQSWPVVQPFLEAEPEAGALVLGDVAYWSEADVPSQLDDAGLAALVQWLFEHIPASGDPAFEPGAHFVSERESLGHFRERLASVLAQRGSDFGLAALEELAGRFPLSSLPRRVRDAQEASLLRWTGPEPGHVIRLAQSHDARIVLSASHLHSVVISALRRISRQLQHGIPPTSGELWNTVTPPRPKAEEEISSWLASRLQADLKLGGRVVGRELEVRPNKTGRGRGLSIDIVVATPVGARVSGAATAAVLIEVKGVWHKDLRTALDEQLAERYLTAESAHGIYCVFWFGREPWDRADYRRGRWTKTLSETEGLFSGQAAAASIRTGLTIAAVVADGSLR